jgi:hypothetical protein
MITPSMAAKAGKSGKAALAKSSAVSTTPASKASTLLQNSHGLSPSTAAKVVAKAKSTPK